MFVAFVFVAFVFVALMAALMVALMVAFAGSLYYIVYVSPRVYVYVHFLNHFIFAK